MFPKLRHRGSTVPSRFSNESAGFEYNPTQIVRESCPIPHCQSKRHRGISLRTLGRPKIFVCASNIFPQREFTVGRAVVSVRDMACTGLAIGDLRTRSPGPTLSLAFEVCNPFTASARKTPSADLQRNNTESAAMWESGALPFIVSRPMMESRCHPSWSAVVPTHLVLCGSECQGSSHQRSCSLWKTSEHRARTKMQARARIPRFQSVEK